MAHKAKYWQVLCRFGIDELEIIQGHFIQRNAGYILVVENMVYKPVDSLPLAFCRTVCYRRLDIIEFAGDIILACVNDTGVSIGIVLWYVGEAVVFLHLS